MLVYEGSSLKYYKLVNNISVMFLGEISIGFSDRFALDKPDRQIIKKLSLFFFLS